VHLSVIVESIIYKGFGFEYSSGHLERQKRTSVTKSQNQQTINILTLMSALIISSRNFCYKTKYEGKYINLFYFMNFPGTLFK